MKSKKEPIEGYPLDAMAPKFHSFHQNEIEKPADIPENKRFMSMNDDGLTILERLKRDLAVDDSRFRDNINRTLKEPMSGRRR